MPNEKPAAEKGKNDTTTNPIIKFLIGFFATVCAITVPRFGPLIAAKDATNIAVPSTTFIVASVIFATLIGVVIMIAEFRLPRVPWETFIRALGVPALIAGSVSTAAVTSTVADDAKVKASLSAAASAAASIPRASGDAITIKPLSGPAPGVWLEKYLPIASAFAQTASPNTSRNVLGEFSPVTAEEPQYAVSLARSATSQEAQREAANLRARVPTAQAVQTSDGFRVISGVKPESAAVLDAIQIKKSTGITPELVRVR